MNVKDVMTQQVLSVTPDESVFVVARLMLQKKISGLPVVDGLGNSSISLAKATSYAAPKPAPSVIGQDGWNSFSVLADLRTSTFNFRRRKVRDVMTGEVLTVTRDAPPEAVVRPMVRHLIKRVPLVEDGKIVGIVTRANLLHAMASFVGEVAPSSAEVTAIREQFIAELKGSRGP